MATEAPDVVEEYVRGWNRQIEQWLDNQSHRLGAEDVWRCHRGVGDNRLRADALPEPYVGDPRASRISAVVLNLNPGQVITPQQPPSGSLVEAVRLRSYYTVASQWAFPPQTLDFWNRCRDWAARLLEPKELSRPPIVGIDLVPWHSKTWGGFEPDDKALDWLRRQVFDPAAAIASNSVLGAQLAKSHGAPGLLAVGAKIRDALTSLRFEVVWSWSEKDAGALVDWPNHQVQPRPSVRSFRLFREPEGLFCVLVTWAAGGNRPPRPDFDKVTGLLLRGGG